MAAGAQAGGSHHQVASAQQGMLPLSEVRPDSSPRSAGIHTLTSKQLSCTAYCIPARGSHCRCTVLRRHGRTSDGGEWAGRGASTQKMAVCFTSQRYCLVVVLASHACVIVKAPRLNS